MTQPHKTPNYIGPGEHSVRELENMCNQFQQIISEMNASQFVKKDDKPMIEEIIDYFKNTPDEQLKKDWESVSDFEDVGPTAKQLIDSWKKDSVSSDVEQAAKEAMEEIDYYNFPKDLFLAGAKWQSTQQPATINWMTDDEIKNRSSVYGHNDDVDFHNKNLTSKTKTDGEHGA